MPMDNLQIKKLSKKFGGLKAIDDISFSLQKGTVTGVIGPNGAGKTTLFNIICNYIQSDKGIIYYKDQDITKFPSHK